MEVILDRHPALGTSWWIEAAVSAEDIGKLSSLVTNHLSNFESRYSRFRTDSLVSQLNTERELKNPDQDSLAIISYGQSLFARTHEHFNFLVGDILTTRGYGQSRPGIITDDTVLANPLTDLLVTPDLITLKNGSVDFGGFGKGYVIDELAQLLKDSGVEYFIINGGGDIYGTSEPDGQPITIHLEHPTAPNTYLGTTSLFNQGFAASSPYKRTWDKGGQTNTHIVGNTKAATFVLAPTARDADAFATAFLLASEDEIAAMHSSEQLGSARYYPKTGEFTAHNFPFVTL